MLKYILLWYRAKTYCPVIDSLRTEPEAWVTGARARNANVYKYYSSDSLVHPKLEIEITNSDYGSYRQSSVNRNGHKLPVHPKRLKWALKARKVAERNKVVEAARKELYKLTQDVHTLRVERIVELRKQLAADEAADFAHRLEHDK